MKLMHKVEQHSYLLIIGILCMVIVGGIVEIIPNFFLRSTVEEVRGVRPYTPLELAGRQIYVREGCYGCHSQMIRPFRDELERYGHYSLAAESMYDRPFQWASKRTGPDLARVGDRYSDDWHVKHMIDPRSVVPESIMPGYPFLADTEIGFENMRKHLAANQLLGVPYTDDQVANAYADLLAQAMPETEAADAFAERYDNVNIRDFDGNPGLVTEMDAMIAYLQVLGTMVDFSAYDAEANFR